jgi:hypothetical protein
MNGTGKPFHADPLGREILRGHVEASHARRRAASAAIAQNNPVPMENTIQISDHVWPIMGWPNIGIVVGSGATQVVAVQASCWMNARHGR